MSDLHVLTEFAPISQKEDRTTSTISDFFGRFIHTISRKTETEYNVDEINTKNTSIHDDYEGEIDCNKEELTHEGDFELNQDNESIIQDENDENVDDDNIIDEGVDDIEFTQQQQREGRSLSFLSMFSPSKKMFFEHDSSNFSDEFVPSTDYWMKDEECKNCYHCQAIFSTFRRRHHCRACGQIFCWRCTEYIEFQKRRGRVCRICLDSLNLLVDSQDQHQHQKISIEYPSQSHEDVASFLEEEYYFLSQHKPVPLSSNMRTFSIYSSFDEDPRQPNQPESSPLVDNENQTPNQEVESREDSSSPPKEALADKWTLLHETSLSQALSDEEGDPLLDTSHVLSHASRSRPRRKISLQQREHQISERTRNIAGLNSDSPLSPRLSKPTSRESLKRVAFEHLMECVYAICLDFGLTVTPSDASTVLGGWGNLVFNFALRASQTLRLKIADGSDSLDIREYLNFKICPGGLRTDCQYIDGVAFRKNFTHKKMFPKPQPSLLLLNSPLEFQPENRLMQLSDLLSQEHSYLQKMCKRISMLSPDLVLVGGNVSRLAQEFLFDMGISLAIHVKPHLLSRLARATEAVLITSPAQLGEGKRLLGSCSKIELRSFEGDSGKTTMMVFDGCDPRFGGCIILRGGPREELLKVKQACLLACFVAYNLHLETQILEAFSCSLPPKWTRISPPCIKIEVPPDPSLFPHVSTYHFDCNSVTEEGKMPLTQQPQGPQVCDYNEWNGSYLSYMYSLYCHTSASQCVPYQLYTIPFYSGHDITLGQFLQHFYFLGTWKCSSPDCGKDMWEHLQAFVHKNGRLTLSLCKPDPKLNLDSISPAGDPILLWSFCKICRRMTRPTPLNEVMWNYSLGHYLELCFYAGDLTGKCSHSVFRDHVRYFYWNTSMVEMEYSSIPVHKGHTPVLRDGWGESLAPKVSPRPSITPPAENTTTSQDKDILEEVENTITVCQHLYTAILNRINTSDWIPSSTRRTLLLSHSSEREEFMEKLFKLKRSENIQNNLLKELHTSLYTSAMSWYSQLMRDAEKQHPRKRDDVVDLPDDTLPSSPPQDSEISSGTSDPGVTFNLDFVLHSLQPDTILHSLVSLADVLHEATPNAGNLNLHSNENGESSASTEEKDTRSPLGAHFPLFLPIGVEDTAVVVYPDDPSSVIAYCLCSHQYRAVMREMADELGETASTKEIMISKIKSEVDMTLDSWTLLKCKCHFALQFEALRHFYGLEREDFVRSLLSSRQWAAKGGKSGSRFSKTLDERLILKEVSRVEIESFLQWVPLYMEFLSAALFDAVPTVLCKILGVFTLRYRQSGKLHTANLVVMENLFFGRNISKQYDLKGSKRSRYAPNENPVLLDKNLLDVMFSEPLWIEEASKSHLRWAIWNDSLFLSTLGVMDYSLLVGIDSERQEVALGIVDYMRKYTWDKQLETWVKSSKFMRTGDVPTVISPNQYKTRFREAMNHYFVAVPCHPSTFSLWHPGLPDPEPQYPKPTKTKERGLTSRTNPVL